MPLASSAATRLRVGGLTPLTTQDYPGELAAVIFCHGCPWRCRYCHNDHLLTTTPDELIAWAEVMAFLKSRRGLLDAVVFSGGEPTAQGALAAAITEVRTLGFKIGLHTGGAYPQRLAALIPLLDWVGLDIKALAADYPQVTGVPDSGRAAWASLELLLAANLALEVRTTPMPGFDHPDYLEQLMQQLVARGVQHYVIQSCHSARMRDQTLGAPYTLNPHALPNLPLTIERR